jgi:hypothetical protein
MNANRNTKTILNIIKIFIEKGYEREAIEAVNELITQIETNEVAVSWNIPPPTDFVYSNHGIAQPGSKDCEGNIRSIA